MNKACKELIEKALPYNGEKLTSIYIINSGTAYEDFDHKNGYNELIIIGCHTIKLNCAKYYNLSQNQSVDLCTIRGLFADDRCRIDIPRKYNCIHLYFGNSMKRLYLSSNLCMEVTK